MTVLGLLAMIALLAAALEPGHRRTDRLPRAPFGADSLATAPVDLDRVRHDLDVAYARSADSAVSSQSAKATATTAVPAGRLAGPRLGAPLQWR